MESKLFCATKESLWLPCKEVIWRKTEWMQIRKLVTPGVPSYDHCLWLEPNDAKMYWLSTVSPLGGPKVDFPWWDPKVKECTCVMHQSWHQAAWRRAEHKSPLHLYCIIIIQVVISYLPSYTVLWLAHACLLVVSHGYIIVYHCVPELDKQGQVLRCS